MTKFDRAGIAARIRGLIGGQDDGDLARTSQRLGIEELSLRMSIDELSPHPTVEVIAAVIREYGVDPAWLLSGNYDAATHRISIENQDATIATVRDFMQRRPFRIAEPPSESFRTNDQN